MPENTFDAATIADWEAALEDRPREIKEIEWLPHIEAFAVKAIDARLAIRLRAIDRSEISFMINPVAARQLAAAILRQAATQQLSASKEASL
jgi:hypothetical protein